MRARFNKTTDVNDLGNGVPHTELVRALQQVVPNLYLAEQYGSAVDHRICSLRQRLKGEQQLSHKGRPYFDQNDLDTKQTDNYVAPLYRGVIPEHDLMMPDGKRPHIYGWRHVLLLVAKQTGTPLRKLEQAVGRRVAA